MATTEAKIERAVQIICDRGADASNRYSGGSGYLVGGPFVLTAAHNLRDGVAFSIRTVSGARFAAKPHLLGAAHDVAVLEVADGNFGTGPPLVSCGRVDRSSDALVTGCSVIGFPSFKQHPLPRGEEIPVRDTAHVRGEINPKANLPTMELEFRVSVVSTPQQGGQFGGPSWKGLSGAALRARYPRSEDLLVGVVTQQLLPEGADVIRAVAISELAQDPELGALLGIGDVHGLPLLPFRPETEVSHYWATVADFERRTPVLLDRDDWLAALENFARGTLGDVAQPYLWLVGPKWSGKTALQAHFAMHSPTDIDCVTYFLGDRTDADSSRFLAVVSDQLARLLGEPADVNRSAAGLVDTYRRLWEWTARRAERERRHLLLTVDGLDDDVSTRRDLPSVASLLPRLLSPWTHVLVTTRERPKIPADVDVSHPIYDAEVKVLGEPSPKVRWRTREVERRHRLCPVCKLSDEAAPVPAIADMGYWAGPQQSRSFAVSSSLAFPDGTAALRKVLDFASKHVVAAGCLALLLSWTALVVVAVVLAAARGAGAALLLAAAVVGGIVWYNQSQQQAALRARARTVWDNLWYCNRDGMVYLPDTGEHFPPSHLRGFVFRYAAQMQAASPEQPRSVAPTPL